MTSKLKAVSGVRNSKSSGSRRSPVKSQSKIEVGGATVEFGDALDRYPSWPAPTVIISDGPYGVAGFPGDLTTYDRLAEWYAPHVAAWSKHSLPETTLWVWGTERGWAEMHGVLQLHGWEYRTCHVWNKGVAHVAGNCNGNTIRRFPVVTEVCVQYVRDVRLQTEDGASLPVKAWLRHEWQRTGMPLSITNKACNVKNAATRKYFTQCHLWYFPPPDMMVKLAAYAQKYGRLTKRPYFSIDGKTKLTAASWAKLRSKWNHIHGVTNVWTTPALRNAERLRDERGHILHTNQKPLRLVEQTILASSDPGDVVWEPFGGLCTAAVSAVRTGRRCFAAEISRGPFDAAAARLLSEVKQKRATNVR
jgi:hypothetical protein